MKVSVALAFEDGDSMTADYTLKFADGSVQVLNHVQSQLVVDLELFQAEVIIPPEASSERTRTGRR
jgi:hypothetical protein